MTAKFFEYLKAVKGELSHISFPTQRQAILYTVMVITVALLIATFLGFLDFVFTNLLDDFVLRR